MYTFSLKIDDEANSLNESDGLSIKELAELLKNLHKALPDTGDKCTLSEISGNCYKPSISCYNKITHDSFIKLMKDIEYNGDLARKQLPFKRTIEKIIQRGFFCEAYDNEENLVATISTTEKPKIGFRYSTEIIYGVLSEIGGKSLERNHIVIYCEDDLSHYTIPITTLQDTQLKEHYKNGIIKFEILFKYNTIDKSKYPTQLVSFKPKSNKTFFQLVDDFTNANGDIIEGTDAFERLIENRSSNPIKYES